MAPLFNTLVILGFGLIGGSVAAACKARGVVRNIVGVARTQETLRKAFLHQLADSTTSDPTAAVKDADMVLLATPVGSIVNLAERVASHAPRGTIFSDVGSVKASVVSALEAVLPKTLPFVGAHPLAGKERAGVEAASADLFEGRTCIVTPTEHSSTEAVERVVEFWEALGSEVVLLEPQVHDVAVAAISHLPQVLASSLVQAAARTRTPSGSALAFAAGGFRDTSRVASSNPEMWRDICLYNRDALKQVIRNFTEILEQFQTALDEEDGRRLESFFQVAKEQRDLYFPS